MKLVFLKPGEYRNGRFVTEVTEENLKAETIFNVHTENAVVYIKKDIAKEYSEEPDISLEDVKKLTLPKLLEYAEKYKIDLGDAEKKADVLEAILRVLDPESFKEKDLTFEDVKDFNIDQLKVFVDTEKIDLGEAKTPEEILKVIEDYFESKK